MLNSISSFLFGGSSSEEPTTEAEGATANNESQESPDCRLKESGMDEEWILIDRSSRDCSPARRSSDGGSAAPPSPFLHPAARPSARAAGGAESSDSDNGGNSMQRMQESPLENLLIEHPSMSVYQNRLRQNSAGIDSDISETDTVSDGADNQARARRRNPCRGQLPTRTSPRNHSRTLTGRSAASASHQALKATDLATRRTKKRQLSVSKLARDNLTSTRVVKRQRNKFVMQPAPRSTNKRS